MSKKRNIVIGALLVAIVAMSVGYAALAQQLVINGKSNLNASWQIEFTDIVEKTMTGAKTKGEITATGTSASFEVDLAYPGATATYEITVANKGSIDATLESITGVDTANAAEPVEVQYEVTGIATGDALDATASKKVLVTVTWVASTDAENPDTIPTTTSKTATINLNFVQKTA